jgi:hypothetical protein
MNCHCPHRNNETREEMLESSGGKSRGRSVD